LLVENVLNLQVHVALAIPFIPNENVGVLLGRIHVSPSGIRVQEVADHTVLVELTPHTQGPLVSLQRKQLVLVVQQDVTNLAVKEFFQVPFDVTDEASQSSLGGQRGLEELVSKMKNL